MFISELLVSAGEFSLDKLLTVTLDILGGALPSALELVNVGLNLSSELIVTLALISKDDNGSKGHENTSGNEANDGSDKVSTLPLLGDAVRVSSEVESLGIVVGARLGLETLVELTAESVLLSRSDSED